MKRSNPRPSLSVTADGKGVAAHAGTRLLAEMADFVGLTSALSDALAPTVRRSRRHDPGRVLLDVALTLADGGDCLSDLCGAARSAGSLRRRGVDADGQPGGRFGRRRSTRCHTSGPGEGPCSGLGGRAVLRCAAPGR